MKDVDLGEPTSSPNHIYLGCTQRECEMSKEIVDNYRNMFESRISPGATEQLPIGSGEPDINVSSWSDDMAGYAEKCVERYCELATKTTQQLFKVATPCIFGPPNSKKRKRNQLENCQKFALIKLY